MGTERRYRDAQVRDLLAGRAMLLLPLDRLDAAVMFLQVGAVLVHPVVERLGAAPDHRPDRVEDTQHEPRRPGPRSEEHTSELQSLMRNSYAVFCLKKKKNIQTVIDNNV